MAFESRPNEESTTPRTWGEMQAAQDALDASGAVPVDRIADDLKSKTARDPATDKEAANLVRELGKIVPGETWDPDQLR